MDLTTDIVTIHDSYEHIQETGIFFQKKTVESLLAFSVVVHTLRLKCDEDSKEEFAPDFNALCLEYWGLSQSGASQALKVGVRAKDFGKYLEKLPASSRALYELATIPQKQLEQSIEQGLINPNLSVTEAKSLKLSFKEDKEAKKKKEVPVNDNPFAEENLKEPIDGEAEIIVDDKPTKKKMKAPEAIDMLNINVMSYYKTALKSGLFPAESLAEAYTLLTGEKI